MNNCSGFFANKSCEFYPCHKIDNEDEFNCMFCYCPLYALGTKCGGNMAYTSDGIKDCSNCLVPHTLDAAEHIMKYWGDIVAITAIYKEE